MASRRTTAGSATFPAASLAREGVQASTAHAAERIEHALRTLTEAKRPGGVGDAVASIPERAEELSLVWHVIADLRGGARNAATEVERANLRHGLVIALAQSIEALLRHGKLDRDDLLGQLLYVGGDLVGAVTALPLPSS